MLDSSLPGRLKALEYRPPVLRDGRPRHGAFVARGRVVRFISRGPGVPVPARNPLGRVPRRIDGYSAADSAVIDWREQTFERLSITPERAPSGTIVAVIVEG